MDVVVVAAAEAVEAAAVVREMFAERILKGHNHFMALVGLGVS